MFAICSVLRSRTSRHSPSVRSTLTDATLISERATYQYAPKTIGARSAEPKAARKLQWSCSQRFAGMASLVDYAGKSLGRASRRAKKHGYSRMLHLELFKTFPARTGLLVGCWIVHQRFATTLDTPTLASRFRGASPSREHIWLAESLHRWN